MPTQGDGAIGALDYTDEERKILAKKSRDFCCSSCARKNIEILPDIEKSEAGEKEEKRDEGADELISMMNFAYEGPKPAASSSSSDATPKPATEAAADQTNEEPSRTDKGKGKEAGSAASASSTTAPVSAPAPAPAPLPAPRAPAPSAIRLPPQQARNHPRPPHPQTPTMPTPPARESPDQFASRIRRERMYIDALIAIVVGLIGWLISRRMAGWLSYVAM